MEGISSLEREGIKMSKARVWFFACLVLLLASIAGCSGENQDQSDCSQVNNAQLAVGAEAPDFRLQDYTGRYITLSDYKDKTNVVIAFFPAAFTPV
jgi:cytochrome oxidase Cu insertion factor (SCO1/SenC/PrrC family)